MPSRVQLLATSAAAFRCATMDSYLPYLIMRDTREDPRCYGARLHVGHGYNESKDFGSMVSANPGGLPLWRQSYGLVEASFGHNAAKRLDVNDLFAYVLEDGRWRDQHPYLGPSISISYRRPGTHPEEDEWESADADSFVRVTDAEGDVWYVATLMHLDSAFLIIPSDIANQRLRQAAVAPDVEVTER